MANNFDPAVSWSDDEIGSTAKLNQMVENDNVLYNLVPHFLYRRGAGNTKDFNDSQSRVQKPTIFAVNGYWKIRGKVSRTSDIPFPPDTFAPDCRPVVNVTIASGNGTSRFAIHTISAMDGSPDVKNDGFRLKVYNRDGVAFTDDIYVHAIAFGWQEA